MCNILFSFRPIYITGKPFWCKSKSFLRRWDLFYLSCALGLINLSIAPGHVHPEQWKAASAADVSWVPPRIIDYKRKSDLTFCNAERTFREGVLRKKSSKMHALVIFCNVSRGVFKSLSSLRATLCVFELCGFLGGGVWKRTRRRATPSSSPRRRRLRRMAWSQAQPMSSRSEPGQLPATGASAEGSSSKLAQCVSLFNYCQPLSLQRLPETSQGIDTFAESASFYWLHPLTLETSGTSWLCTWCICPLLPCGEAGNIQASWHSML